MASELSIDSKVSWKDKLIGSSSMIGKELEKKNDFELLDGDIQRFIINGTLSIEFSNRINQILVKDMANTMVIKLLRRNIGLSILQNKIYNLWKLSSPFHLIDIENGYFLTRFQNKFDCEKVLSEGPWIIFGQYLTVQPWSLSFNPAQTFSSTIMPWIRLLRLPSYFYKRKILVEIRGLICKVAKLDMNTNK